MNASYLTSAVTLFRPDGALDLDSQERLYESLLSNGMDGVLILGPLGEFFAMPLAQREDLARFTLQTLKGRARCVVGVSSVDPDEIVPFAETVFSWGADAVELVSPCWFQPDDEAQFLWYDDLLSAIEGPVYVCNYPERTGYSLSPETVVRLAGAHKNLKGIEDRVAETAHTRDLLKAVRTHYGELEVYAGEDEHAVRTALSGGNGVMGGLANAAPEVCRQWMEALRRENMRGIAEGQRQIDRLSELYSLSPMRIPVLKEAARLRGVARTSLCTFPMRPVTAEQSAAVRRILSREGFRCAAD